MKQKLPEWATRIGGKLERSTPVRRDLPQHIANLLEELDRAEKCTVEDDRRAEHVVDPTPDSGIAARVTIAVPVLS